LSTLEKGGAASASMTQGKKGADGDYYLEDDEALMRLMQRVE
jgi:hypothetical protein